MRNKVIIVLSGITVLVMFGVIGQFYSKRRGRIEFEKFNNSEIHGVIETKIDASVSGTHFKVNGQTYTFHPYTADINNNSIFNYVGDIGDSISKAKRADTLFLIKSKATYKYTFAELTDKPD